MPSQRCSTCNIHYALGVSVCPACKGETWLDPAEDPDEWAMWRAENIRQEAEEGYGIERRQPYRFFGMEFHELVEGRTFACSVADIYRFEDRRFMLREGDIIEAPAPERYVSEASGPWMLLESVGTIRPQKGGTHYNLRRMFIPDTVPHEWVVEFSGGGDGD